ncbi:SUN domain-containing protein 1-like isoform X2 [Megalops cyprinoides]|uniref:SUN domain-containing protein 1-like isoform X2 n=1 Tax=Megalops cyprinoides TaxID=118141 RepID=UPI001864807A|nr:SUN domain-containing protein 1-like isoform X2 [Megalops cyprinoides]
MTMDYSHLHTYTPPQCAPKNTGYTYSLSSSYSSAALDFEKEHRIAAVFDSPKMSRRSLRLHTAGAHYGDDSPADSSFNHSVAYSASGVGRRESKTLRSRRQERSATGSQSLLHTPRKPQSSATLHGHGSLHSCTASDASLLSSLLDESSIQERTVVDSFWGLDDDTDLKEQSMRADRSMTLLNGEFNMAQAQTQTTVLNGYVCRDCTIHSERKDALTAYPSSSSLRRSASGDAAAAPSSPPSSTVYYRDKSRKHKSGFLVSLSDTCVRYSRRVAVSIASLMTLLVQNVLLKIRTEGKAHSSYCGSMNVKDLVTDGGHLSLNGSLCDDCKGKQHLEKLAVHAQPSRARRLVGALWRVVAFTGYCLLQAVRSVGSAGWSVTRALLSVLWLAAVSPGKAAAGVFWWLGTGWYHLVTLISLLNVFILTRCLPKLYKLLLFLFLFLLLLGLWYWGPSTLLGYLPAVNLTEWRASSSLPWALTPLSTEQVSKGQGHPGHTAPTPALSQRAGAAVSVDTERLSRLEERLALLLDSVQRGGRLQEQQHGEVLGLYGSLREQLDRQTDRDSLGLWVSGLLDQRLTLLRGELQQDAARREEGQEQYVAQQRSHESRLAELETLLQALAAKTEEVQQRQEMAPPASVSAGVDSAEHSTLLGEVQRLEAELGRIRQDLQGVIGCRGKCEQLDGLQDTVSAQVRRELRALFYGAERAEEGAELPEPLLQWLSAQFARGSDLQASLASLEQRILNNLTLQVERGRQPPCVQAVTETVARATEAAGMTEEHVQLIVQNALRLYSHDRTGLVDYALESGGGSILSTRCSETYETKTALMSLFGVPLWYFSQSPRVVIQPDVHPGNCWAFKGSQGYLVIRLSLSVLPSAFSLEHIPKSLSPTGNISSAPRQFSVYGLDDENQEEGKLLGQYTYQEDRESLQTFPVSEENDQAYQIIEMRVLSNWGHPEYTCLYRFRVHGEPSRK